MEIKELLAELSKFDEMEDSTGLNISEELDEEKAANIYKKAYSSLKDLVDYLEDNGVNPATGEFVDDMMKTFHNKLKETLDEIYSHSLAFDTMVKYVNETKELAGEEVKYLFDVQVTMDAENEMSNAFIKTEIQRAIENTLDKYDVEVSVQNA